MKTYVCWLVQLQVILLCNPVIDKIVNNQVVKKIKIVVKSDVKNWVYISLR